MTLLGAAQIRELAEAIGLKPAKALGQNFVIDSNVCKKIVRIAGVTSTDIALEIGPGLGSLTLALLEEAASVVAVEIDPRLAQQLPLTAAIHSERADQLTVINQDALGISTLFLSCCIYWKKFPHFALVLSWCKQKLQIDLRHLLEVKIMEFQV